MTTRDEYRARRKMWVEALRSGKYKQTQEMLIDTDPESDDCGGFCCLGVACDVSGLGTWSKGDDYVVGNDKSSTELPVAVAEWLGMKDTCGRYGVGYRDTLVEQNDNGATFAKIADIIEERAADLFIPEAL